MNDLTVRLRDHVDPDHRHAVVPCIRCTAADEIEWLRKVAVRMYRHLEELGVDSYTLTALNVALKIGRTDER